MSFLVVAIVFLVCNDLLEFIDNFTGRIIAKVVIAAIIISITIFLMFYIQFAKILCNENLMNEFRTHKKGDRNGLNNI